MADEANKYTIDQAMALITPLKSNKAIDVRRWLIRVDAILGKLKAGLRNEFILLNPLLASKIDDPEIYAIFIAKDDMKEIIAKLLAEYSTDDQKEVCLAEAKLFRQRSLELNIYVNNKIKLLRLAEVADDSPKFIEYVLDGMNSEYRQKFGYAAINFATLEFIVTSIMRERKNALLTHVDDDLVTQNRQLRKEIDELKAVVNYTNYEGRGRRGRGARQGGHNNNGNNNMNNNTTHVDQVDYAQIMS